MQSLYSTHGEVFNNLPTVGDDCNWRPVKLLSKQQNRAKKLVISVLYISGFLYNPGVVWMTATLYSVIPAFGDEKVCQTASKIA